MNSVIYNIVYVGNMKGETKSVNLDLELWKLAEILAIDKGISVSHFAEEAVRKKIEKEGEYSSVGMITYYIYASICEVNSPS